LSDVRLGSGGDMRPEEWFEGGCGQPAEYGGGGFEYIEVGLTMAVAAMLGAEEYVRSLSPRSLWSRLINDKIPLRE